MRQSLVTFVLLKALTTPLSLVILVVIASLLPRDDFAIYVWLFAFGLLFQQIFSFGINWVALHYIPAYRAGAGVTALRRFVLGLLGLYAGVVVLLAAILLLAAPTVVALVGRDEWLAPFRLYLAVVAVDAIVAFLRDCVFAPLLKQGTAQAIVLVHNVLFLGGLLLAQAGGAGLGIEGVIYAQLTAVTGALLLAAARLSRALGMDDGEARVDGLRGRSQLARFAANNYAQDLVRVTAGGHVMTMIGARLLDLAGLAVFGFIRTLAEHLSRLLPAQLFMSMLRPKVIASYGEDRCFASLNRRAVLILKISNGVLAAGAAVLVAYGRPILEHLSGGRYGDGYGLLLVFLLWLAVVTGERVIAVVANVIERSEFLRRAALVSPAVVPLALVLTWLGAGAYGLVAAMVAGGAGYVLLVVYQLRRAGYHITFDARGHARLAGAALCASAVGVVLSGILPGTVAALVLGIGLTLASFIGALRLFRPFDAAERGAIERLVGRRIVLL